MQYYRSICFPLYRISSFGISLNSARNVQTIVSLEDTGKGECDAKLDGFTLVQIIRTCTKTRNVSYGEQLHCHAFQTGFCSDVYVCTSLVSFYAKVVCVENARKVFDEMPEKNVVSWNSLISGYVHSGNLSKALWLFNELNRSEISTDGYSFTSALATCGQLRFLSLGMSIHSKVILHGFESSIVVANCLIDMYGKCDSVKGSINVFDGLLDKDLISWNSVIAACARNRKLDLAFNYFYRMSYPDTVTYNELINGLSRFGNINDARMLLRSMPNPDSSSWNSILSAYVVRNRTGEALEFLTEMHGNGVLMDEFTFSSILTGIACISALRWGMKIHCCAIKHGLVASTIIGSALVDMYSKCGQGEEAEAVFHSLPRKNIVTWNALISGLAHNGESAKVVQYFEELKKECGLKPNDVTFINVLAACSHNEIPLEKAYGYFKSMVDDYGIEPKPEHVTSVIRLMGHHRELCKAVTMIDELELGSCAVVWKALLGACGMCGDSETAKIAMARFLKLDKIDEFGYVTLSNLNKGCENWEDATAVWDAMKDKGVKKGAGFSWVEHVEVPKLVML